MIKFLLDKANNLFRYIHDGVINIYNKPGTKGKVIVILEFALIVSLVISFILNMGLLAYINKLRVKLGLSKTNFLKLLKETMYGRNKINKV
jgi:hypothetical protein